MLDMHMTTRDGVFLFRSGFTGMVCIRHDYLQAHRYELVLTV